MSSYRPNYTAVVIGRKPGIYASYEEALKQVDGYPGALFRGFSEHSDAAVRITCLPSAPQLTTGMAAIREQKTRRES